MAAPTRNAATTNVAFFFSVCPNWHTVKNGKITIKLDSKKSTVYRNQSGWDIVTQPSTIPPPSFPVDVVACKEAQFLDFIQNLNQVLSIHSGRDRDNYR